MPEDKTETYVKIVCEQIDYLSFGLIRTRLF